MRSPQYTPATLQVHGDFNSHSQPPGDLDLTLQQVRNVTRGMDNLSANFGASVTFLCRVISKHATNWLDVTILTIEVTAHAGDAGHRTPSMYQVWSFKAFLFWRFDWFSITALSGLVTSTFDLKMGSRPHGSPVSCASYSANFKLLKARSHTARRRTTSSVDGRRRCNWTRCLGDAVHIEYDIVRWRSVTVVNVLTWFD